MTRTSQMTKTSSTNSQCKGSHVESQSQRVDQHDLQGPEEALPARQPPADRSLFEHLLYACCLENARPKRRTRRSPSCSRLFDWNEVRVTTVTELAETMSSLPDGAAAANG